MTEKGCVLTTKKSSCLHFVYITHVHIKILKHYQTKVVHIQRNIHEKIRKIYFWIKWMQGMCILIFYDLEGNDKFKNKLQAAHLILYNFWNLTLPTTKIGTDFAWHALVLTAYQEWKRMKKTSHQELRKERTKQ